MHGRPYNRSVRIHKVVLGALTRLQLQAFGEWRSTQNLAIDVQAVARSILALRRNVNSSTFGSLIQSTAFKKLRDVFDDYCQHLLSPMAAFWQTYIDMVLLLLRFIRATREGNWELHKARVRDMLPWMFAYDRIH